MKKNSPRKRDSFTATVLRLLRINRGFSEPPSSEEPIHTVIPVNNQRNHQRRIGTAWLDVERKKAEALMELQRRRVIC
jgi:hypothetical protein